MKKRYCIFLFSFCYITINAHNEYLILEERSGQLGTVRNTISNVSILSDQIGEYSIANYNTTTNYSFYTDIQLQNYQWRFEIKKTDG